MNGLMNILQAVSRQSRSLIVILGLIVVLQVGVLDFFTGTELSISIFYLIPIAVVAWLVGKGAGVGIGVASAISALEADLLSGQVYSHPLIAYWNALVRLGFFLIVCELLTELKEKSAREKELVGIDDLTTLVNRKTFFGLANGELARARRYRHPMTLFYLDLDDFKLVNDRDGHGTGDALLFRVADTLSGNARATDVVGRLGGDEFGILLPNTSYEQGQVALTRLTGLLRATLAQHTWNTTWSLGAVTFELPPASVDAMVCEAEELVGAVKLAGKNGMRHERARLLEVVPVS